MSQPKQFQVSLVVRRVANGYYVEEYQVERDVRTAYVAENNESLNELVDLLINKVRV